MRIDSVILFGTIRHGIPALTAAISPLRESSIARHSAQEQPRSSAAFKNISGAGLMCLLNSAVENASKYSSSCSRSRCTCGFFLVAEVAIARRSPFFFAAVTSSVTPSIAGRVRVRSINSAIACFSNLRISSSVPSSCFRKANSRSLLEPTHTR